MLKNAMKGVDLRFSRLVKLEVFRVNLDGSDLLFSDFYAAHLREVRLFNLNLQDVNFIDSNIDEYTIKYGGFRDIRLKGSYDDWKARRYKYILENLMIEARLDDGLELPDRILNSSAS